MFHVLIRSVPAVLLPLVLWATALSAAETCLPSALDRGWILHFAGQSGKAAPGDLEALATSGVVTFFPVRLWPSSGPAPLAVGISWWPERPENLRAVEIDANGDGVPEVVDDRDEQLGYTYHRPGHFPATVTIRDRQGKVTIYKRAITVLTLEAFDTELQGRWAAFRAALKRGEFEAAQECVHTLARERNESTLRGWMRGDVEGELPPIRFVRFQVMEALYESVRPPPGETRPLHVRFLLDLDGRWRLVSFEPKELQP